MKKKVTKRISIKNTSVTNYLLAMVLVLIIASILILIQGSNPIEAFRQIIVGSMGSRAAIARSIRWITPVIIASMAAVVAHRSGIINLGIDGQVYVGAFFSALAGAYISLPSVVHIPVAILIGGISGALFAFIPSLLKGILKINEMVVTLMFNYVAILMTEYLTMQIMNLDADIRPEMIATPEILETAKLTQIMPPYQATTGIFIAIVVFVVLFLFYKLTKRGYEWKMIGQNFSFSKYGGIKTLKNYIIIFMTSGFIAGLAGAVEILGPHLRFRSNFSSNIGWDGIMVALIAKDNPKTTFVVAIIWGLIKAGSLAMERTTSVNRILVTLVQALFVLFITVDLRELLVKAKNFVSKKTRKEDEVHA